LNYPPEASVGRERVLLRWGLAVFAVLVALVAGAFFSWQLGQRRQEAARVIARLETLADARKDAVRSWLRERRADAQVLAWDPDLIEICLEGACPKGMDPSRLLSHLENQRFFSGFLGAYLFTPAGLALLAADEGQTPGAEDTVKARQAAREQRFLLHDLHRGADGTPRLGFLAPVFHRVDPQERPEDAPVLGVIGLYLDPRDTLFSLLATEEPYAWDAETYLVRREEGGVRLLSSARGAGPAPGTELLSLPDHSALEYSAAVDGERAGQFVDFRGTRVLAAVRWIAEGGWGLVAKVDEAQALAPWRRDAVTEGVLLGSALLCLLLGGVAVWRWWSMRQYRLLLEGVRDREERLRALAHGSDDVVFLKGIDGRFLLVNPAAADLLGAHPDEAVGRRTRDYLDPAVSQALEGHDREVLKTGVTFHGEEVVPYRGTLRTFLSSRVPMRDHHGNLQGVAGVLRDITDRKRDELALVRWAQTLGALYRLARGLTAATEVAAVHQCLLEGVGAALEANLTALYAAGGQAGQLWLVGGRHLPPGFDKTYGSLATDTGLVAEVVAHGEWLAAAEGAASSEAVARFAAEAGVASLLAVPLGGASELSGLLVLGFFAPREFRTDEEEALALLGHMAGVAAERCAALASLAAEAEVRGRAEERLRQLHAATASLTGEELFRRVAATVAAEVGAKLVMVSKVTADERAIPYAAVYEGEPVAYPPYSLAGTPGHQVVSTKRFQHLARGLQEAFPECSLCAERRFVGYLGLPLMDASGRVIGLLTAFHDAPLPLDVGRRDLLELYALRLSGELGRLVAEEQLGEARRALDTLIENLPGAVYRSGWHPARPLQFISAGSWVATGYRPDELLGDGGPTWSERIVAEDRPRVWREIQAAVAEARHYATQYRIHDRDGAVRWMFDVGSAVWPTPRTGAPVALEGILFDYTERRSLEAQLSHSQRLDALGRLAGGVAHDFNNLLTTISGYTELLAARLPGDPRAAKAADEVRRATERAAELTRSLLAFGRRQVVEPKVVELDELVAGADRMLARLVGEDIRFAQHLDAAGAQVRVDPGQVEQVLFHLVVNAREAMPGGGELQVSTCLRTLAVEGPTPNGPIPSGAYVELAVTDTGVGMTPEVVEELFDPFFTTKAQGGRSGLGLPAVYGTVRQAGGHVVVQSKAGEGTTVRVLWPLCRPPREPAPVPDTLPAPSLVEKGILLVEDQQAVRELAEEHLTELGYRVYAFADPQAALDSLAELSGIAALVTDLVMPGMSGTQLARTIRSRRPALPVVYISGHAGGALEEIDLTDPRTAFLQKPFRLNALEQALRKVLATERSVG